MEERFKEDEKQTLVLDTDPEWEGPIMRRLAEHESFPFDGPEDL